MNAGARPQSPTALGLQRGRLLDNRLMKADDETEREVLSVLRAFNDHLEARNCEGMLGLFVSDPDVTLVGSEAAEIAVGPSELRAFFQRLFARPGTFRFEWRTCHVSAGGDVAWVFADALAHYSEPGNTATVPYRTTGVLARHGDRWRIAHYHGSEPVSVQE
jgi:ketosteroid isomerase-like protein